MTTEDQAPGPDTLAPAPAPDSIVPKQGLPSPEASAAPQSPIGESQTGRRRRDPSQEREGDKAQGAATDGEGAHHSFPEALSEPLARAAHHSFPEAAGESLSHAHHPFPEADPGGVSGRAASGQTTADRADRSSGRAAATRSATRESSSRPGGRAADFTTAHHSFEPRAHHSFGQAPHSSERVHHSFPEAPSPGSHTLAWLGKQVLESRARDSRDASTRRERIRDGETAREQSPAGPGATLASGLDLVRPSSREILGLLEREPRARVREALVRLLDRALVLERFDACLDRRERRALLRALGARGRLRGRLDPGRPSSEPRALAGAARDQDVATAVEIASDPGALDERDTESRSGAPDAVHNVSRTRDVVPGPVEAPEKASLETARREKASPRAGRRRARAPHPLWSPEDEPEKREVFGHVAAILERANREFGATFDVERSRRDTLLYSYEVVRSAVANVLLKQSRGYRFENPGAVLWDGITLPRYRLEEFAVANLEEVLKRVAGLAPPAASTPAPARPPATGEAKAPSPERSGEIERKRAEALRELYLALPDLAREDLDRRAREMALEGFCGRGSPLDESVLALRVLRARDELLAREGVGQRR